MKLTDFQDGARDAVIKALDTYVEELTSISGQGWKDQELPALFRGLDAHTRTVAERINRDLTAHDFKIDMDN